MPHLVQPMKIMDGGSHVTMHWYIKGDGSSLDLKDVVLLDPYTDLVPTMPKQQNLIVKRIWYELTGFSARLAFNSTTPWEFWTLSPGASLRHDWRFFGGIRDNSDFEGLGLDSDGKLLLSTTGLSNTGASGAFVLWMERRNRLNPQPPVLGPEQATLG